MRFAGLALALLLALGAGCATTTPTAPSPPAPTSSSAAPVPAGSLRIDGAVRTPATLDAAALAAMPQTEVVVSFGSAQGQQTHRERGVPLAALLPTTALTTDPARKNDQLTFGVVGVGADGYQALVSYGEASPDFGNRGVLVSLTEDGAPLPRPRLVVPGDVKGGRYVSDLTTLHVVRTAT